MATSKNTLLLIGAILAVIGVIAFAIPVFTTEHTEEVAKIGDLRVTAKDKDTHVIPPFIGPAALGIGIVLMGAGLMVRR
jgi:hypothetical protein